MEKNFILFGHLEFYSNAKLTLGILTKAKKIAGKPKAQHLCSYYFYY